MLNRIVVILTMLVFISCGENKSSTEKKINQEINLYTHRHYDTDKEIFKEFESKYGIKVNVVKAKADELIQKMESEGDQSPADVLITVDAGRLVRAKNKNLLQSINSNAINSIVPEYLKDSDNQWFGLTKRARIIAHNKSVSPEELSSYEDLTDPKWKNKILVRSSGNIYNQSLLASIIANVGPEKAKEWANGVRANMARVPKGNDRDQVKAILAGEGDLAIINTYYLGKLLNSKDENEVNAGNAVSIFFPNQDDRGAHINISGIGVAKYAPNKDNAIKFIEYLLSTEVQEKFSEANYEYPVNPQAKSSDLLNSWGTFKEDKLSLSKLGELNKDAVILFDEVKWDKGPDAK